MFASPSRRPSEPLHGLVGPLVLSSLLLALAGCTSDSKSEAGVESGAEEKDAAASDETKTAAGGGTVPAEAVAGEANPGPVTPEKLHDALRASNADYLRDGRFEFTPDGELVAVSLGETGVRNIAPLKGLPLRALDLMNLRVSDLSAVEGMPLERLFLEGTQVEDLKPLRGMPLQALWLNGTDVKDLSPLKGMPLAELNLLGTKVVDLAALEGMPLQTLWLNDTAVKDISVLRGTALVSLTLKGTQVSDIDVVSEIPTLERLHVADTPIKDLSPIKDLALTRLIFTPSRIERGIEEARRMVTIREIGTSLDGRLSPPQFWKLYDQGEFK